jgi:P4 family phage/plasmid primase-like protien
MDNNAKQASSDGFYDFTLNEEPDDLFGLHRYSLIGRVGGEANGDLDPTPIATIISNPALYGIENPGDFRDMKSGCPFSKTGYNRDKSKVSFTVHDDGTFCLICRDKSHDHPQARQKDDTNGNPYWVYVLKPEVARQRSQFPPFTTGSEVEIARMILNTMYFGAEWDGPDTVRTYEAPVARKKKWHKPSATVGKWVLHGPNTIKEAIRHLDGEWIHKGEDKKGNPKFVRVVMNHSKVEGVFKEMLSVLAFQRCKKSQDETGQPVSVFQSPKPCIPLQGSIYDLETGQPVYPNASASKYYYARAEHMMECSMWSPKQGAPTMFLNLLESAWGGEVDHEKRVAFFQEWIGVAMAGEATKHETHVLLKGVAASGKSQVIKVVEGLFPKSAVAHVSPCNLDGFNLKPFISARLNTVAEVPDTGMANATKMKAIQSGDSIMVDRKHKDALVVSPKAAWLLGCNQSWRPSERHDSVFRRWKVLTFNNPVPKDRRIAGLAGKILESEIQSIIAWAVAGYRRFRKNNDRFTEFSTGAAAIAQWRRETDPIRVWLDECVEISDGHETRSSDHYAAYREWAKDNGFKPVSSTRFGIDVKAAEVRTTRTRRGMVHGVRLVTEQSSHPPLELVEL